MAVDRDQLPKGIGQQGDATGQLVRELQAVGANSLFTLDSEGSLSGGVTLLMTRGATQMSEAAASQFRQQLFDALAGRIPVCVQVEDFSDTAAACDLLRDAASRASAKPGDTEIVVAIAELQDGDAALLAERLPVGGIVHLRVGAGAAASCWHELWKLRGSGWMRPAYGTQVVPACSLLSVEAGGCVLPGTGIEVPAGTAWLPVRIDVASLASGNGSVSESVLENILRRAVEVADQLHDAVNWPTPKMRHDAWLNRRLAILIDGFGELAYRRGLNPSHFASLEELSALLAWMRNILQTQSRRIAQQTRRLPALDHADPSKTLRQGRQRERWRRRWLEAIDTAGLRHRNLVVLSPWAVFPHNRPADYRYADLLPLLRFADTTTLAGAPDLSYWNVDKFESFHRRAMAVLQQRSATHHIAEPS